MISIPVVAILCVFGDTKSTNKRQLGLGDVRQDVDSKPKFWKFGNLPSVGELLRFDLLSQFQSFIKREVTRKLNCTTPEPKMTLSA